MTVLTTPLTGPARTAVTHIVAASALAALLYWGPEFKTWPAGGLLGPLVILTLVYLVGGAVPYKVGRALAERQDLPRWVPGAVYLVWGLGIAWLLSSGSFETLIDCIRGLPIFLDSHGFLTVALLPVGGLAFMLIRKTNVRLEDAFSMAATASFAVSWFLTSYLYTEAPLSMRNMGIEVHAHVISYIAAWSALTIGLVAGWRLPRRG